jgi:hypothetical protein
MPPESIFDLIANYDSSRTIIYLGHGTADEINVNTGIDSVIGIEDAKQIFKRKKIILLSCFSSEFINSLNNEFDVAIGFGNILSSRAELSYKDYTKYNHDDFKCIDTFKTRLVKLFKTSIIEAYSMNYTFLKLYNSLKLRVNKIISQCSLSKDKTEQLVGDLMFDLKKEMTFWGNSTLLLS